jgi:hypothetical protein
VLRWRVRFRVCVFGRLAPARSARWVARSFSALVPRRAAPLEPRAPREVLGFAGTRAVFGIGRLRAPAFSFGVLAPAAAGPAGFDRGMASFLSATPCLQARRHACASQ